MSARSADANPGPAPTSSTFEPGADAGAAPALEHGRTPDGVLDAEAIEFLVVRAEEIAALRRHQSHFALRRRWNRTASIATMSAIVTT